MAESLDEQDKRGRTPLHWAIINNETDKIAKLLKAGANPNIRDNHGRNGFTPLYYAAVQSHNVRAVQLLMAAKAKVDDTTKTEFMRQFDTDNTRVDRSRMQMRKMLGLY